MSAPRQACRHSATLCRAPSSSCPCTKGIRLCTPAEKRGAWGAASLLCPKTRSPKSAEPAQTMRKPSAREEAAPPEETATPAAPRKGPRLPIASRHGVAYRGEFKTFGLCSVRVRQARTAGERLHKPCNDLRRLTSALKLPYGDCCFRDALARMPVLLWNGGFRSGCFDQLFRGLQGTRGWRLKRLSKTLEPKIYFC